MTLAGLPTIGTVMGSAVIDSINPCAIGVLILLVSTLFASARQRKKLLKIGLIYIAAVFATYFLAGLGLAFAFTSLPVLLAEYISIIVGVAIIGGGLIEIKDFFWYGKGFSLAISPGMVKRIHNYVSKISIPGVIVLGVFVSLVELPCTGGPYLAVIKILSESFDMFALSMLVLYNIIFVLPLVVILLLVHFGTKIFTVKKWKQKNRAYMRLLTGILLILLGWLLILLANGTINLG